MSLNLLILGRGKTGSLVAEIARERGHEITLLCAADNLNASALTQPLASASRTWPVTGSRVTTVSHSAVLMSLPTGS